MITQPNPPTESAVRAADKLTDAYRMSTRCYYPEDEVNASESSIARIIDTSCHLPELKEVLERAEKALKLIKDQAEFYCKNYCQPVYGKYKRHHADCPIHYATDTLEALAAIEKVKI